MKNQANYSLLDAYGKNHRTNRAKTKREPHTSKNPIAEQGELFQLYANNRKASSKKSKLLTPPIPLKPFEQKDIILNVERYANDQLKAIQDNIFKYGIFQILQGGCNIGKTTALLDLKFDSKKVIVCLPRILNIKEQITKFKGYKAIYDDLKNFGDSYSSDKILCTHKGLLSVLEQCYTNDITVIVDEFHSFSSNMDKNERHDETINYLKDNNIKTLFVSATIYDCHKVFYNASVIKIESKYLEEQRKKQSIKIYEYKKVDTKGIVKDDFIKQVALKTKEDNRVLFVWVEDRKRIKEYVPYYNSIGYKAIGLSSDTEEKERDIILNNITSKNIPYDIVFHTSTVEAGINLIAKNVDMLIVDTFIPYIEKKRGSKIHNPLRIEQLKGRSRCFGNITIYIDFENESLKHKTLNYQDWEYKKTDCNWDLKGRTKELHSHMSTYPDGYILFNKYGQAYYSETKKLHAYLDYKHSRLSTQDLANELGAEIIEHIPEEIIKPSKEKFKGLKSCQFKDVLRGFLLHNFDETITKLVDLKIIERDYFYYTPYYTIDIHSTFNQDFEKHCINYQSMITSLLRDYKILNDSKEFTKVEIYDILDFDKERQDVIKHRIRAGSLDEQYRKDSNSIECLKRRKDVQTWKVFADNIKTIVREKPYSIKEIHSIGRQVIKNTLTIKDMFHILDIFYNVETNNTENTITKLRVINSKNKYFLAHEYGEKGKVVCTSHDDETDKKILVKREPTNYKKFKDSEEKKSFIMKIE